LSFDKVYAIGRYSRIYLFLVL